MTLPVKQSFELYVDDDRYAVPTLHLIFAWDRRAALEMANNLVEASAHHRGAELCQDGRMVAGLGSYARPRPKSALLRSAAEA